MLEHGGDHSGAVGPFALDYFHPVLGLELTGKEEGASSIDGGEGGLDAGDVVHGEGEEVSFFYLQGSAGGTLESM